MDSQELVFFNPPMPATSTLSHTQPLGPASGLYLLGGCSFKAQIYLLKMLLFRDRELTATAHTQQPGGRSGAMEAAGDSVAGKPSHFLTHGSGVTLFWDFGFCEVEQAGSSACWHLNEGTLNSVQWQRMH